MEEKNSKKNKKLKIISYGDNPYVSTGYGQVWLNLLSRWCKLRPDWAFYHLGWQNRDRPHKTLEGYTMLPMGKKEYGFDTVFENLMKYKPDFLVTLCDVGWQSGFIEGVRQAKINGWKGKWVAYTPVDTDAWAMTWDEVFKEPDINVAMSKFGETKLKEHSVENIITIPHGADIETFKPIEDRNSLKQKYGLAGKFAVGFVGRNQVRKMLDRLMLAFKNFSKGKDDVVLVLHTDMEPPQQGWSIPYLQWKFQIADKLKLTKGNLDIDARQRIQPEGMNEIYNMMDVFCYATGGEGFGLPGLECQASGVPLLMTDCTTAYDLCQEENKIPVLKDKYGRECVNIGTNGVHFVYPDDVAMSELLDKKYKKWKTGELQEEAKKARAFAETYGWDEIAKVWLDLFEKGD